MYFYMPFSALYAKTRPTGAALPTQFTHLVQLTIRRHVQDQGLLYYPNNRYCTGDIHHWVLIVFVVLVIIVRSPASRASWEFLVTVGLAVLCLVYVEVHFIAEDFSHLLQRLACVLKLSALLFSQMREKIAHP